MKSIQVVLAEREYSIQPLPMRAARVFREKIGNQVSQLANSLKGADMIEATDLNSIADLVGILGGTLAGSVDMIGELLFEFSPELEADRGRIEEQAFDDEIVAAFMEVLKLLYPFGGLLKTLNGQAVRRISMNSPSANGDAGPMSSTRSP